MPRARRPAAVSSRRGGVTFVVSLIERSEPLALLGDVIEHARHQGGGRLVLVSGEAGAGKSALLRAVLADAAADVVRLVGMCDPLRVARPFGPVLDWARTLDRDFVNAVASGSPRDRATVFERALRMMSVGTTVAVIEDVHWADEATLDLVGFLSRRLETTRSVLILTYRTEAADRQGPLVGLLGELAAARPVRVQIEPLSLDAVATLARDHAIDAGDLHRRTAGNAFFVTECLSSADLGVPGTVREAVLARASRLSSEARAVVDAVAAGPGRADLWVVRAFNGSDAGIDECVADGVLVTDGPGVRFRHEMARLAIHDSMLPRQRARLHGLALAALADPPVGIVDQGLCAHHALEAGDVDAFLLHAPLAAAQAERAGAHREAVSHLESMLAHGAKLDVTARIDVLARLADLRGITGVHEAAVEAFEEAVALAREADDVERTGELLARMWGPLSMAGHLDRAGCVAEEATSLLEQRGSSHALALVYAQRCSQSMLARDLTDAERWGAAAIDMATDLGADDVLAYALMQSGVGSWMAGDAVGLERLRRGVELARACGLHRLVAHGLSQIGSGGGEVRRYAEAIPALEECITFADLHELGSRGMYASAWLARCKLETGRWDDASLLLSTVLRSPRCDGVTRMTALTDLGRLRARRGDPDVWAPLDEALDLAQRTGHLQRLWPVVSARAESAWLEGSPAREDARVREVYESAVRLRQPWAIGDLGQWLWRSGAIAHAPGAAAPYALLMSGDAATAAAAWSDLGCPYDAAMARSESPDDGDQLAALATFRRLGAAPAAKRLVDRRRTEGRSVPRGPNGATKANPRGLSDRELEVLRLAASGCTNREIATALRISAKTVGHHVSHALTKLGARTRTEAVVAALGAGIDLAQSGSEPLGKA